MSEEKEGLMKTLKDENLRAETRKFTGNLLKRTRTTNSSIPQPNLKKENKIDNKTEYNNTSENISTNIDINQIEKKSVKKKKKMKKKAKDGEKILKSGEPIKKGQKYKLLKYDQLNDVNNDNKNVEKEQKNDNSKNNENDKESEKNKKLIEKEVKPIIKDKENKTNRTRKDLLNSLSNLQYNFDNLMAIGVHGTKLLNNTNKK